MFQLLSGLFRLATFLVLGAMIYIGLNFLMAALGGYPEYIYLRMERIPAVASWVPKSHQYAYCLFFAGSLLFMGLLGFYFLLNPKNGGRRY